jgi:DNA-binding response OmpR family regulator
MAQILMIDDDEILRRMLSLYLTRAGHEVVTAENGVKGLQAAQNRRFDLVITDLIMPEKEGLETIIALRRREPALRIIAISGGGRRRPEGYLDLARDLGAAATLAKPFSGEDLAATVNSVLEHEAPPPPGRH